MERRVLTGSVYLRAITDLLQRCRLGHPTRGGWEAADLHWWWRKPGITEGRNQVFWFDADERPAAAVHSVDWGDEVEADLAHLPSLDLDAEQRLQLWEDGLAEIGDGASRPICTKADVDNRADLDVLVQLGFEPDAETDTAAWMSAADAPPISALAEDYRLSSRDDDRGSPHHLILRNGPAVEQRLAQTSLYRPDLDLVVRDKGGDVAGYGLFWFDPRTATGLVEPMRTEDAHQRRGIARHVLTTGVARLVALGATRIKISYEDANPASGALYRDVGFVPTTRHRFYVRAAGAGFG